MRDGNGQGYLFSEGGICCPLCGGRMSRGALFCGHCHRSGRLNVDADKVRRAARDVHLPRAINRHYLRRSA